MIRFSLIAVTLAALLLSGCGTTNPDKVGTANARQDVFLPQGEFEQLTVSSPATKQVFCETCNKHFNVTLVKGERSTDNESDQQIVVPAGEQWGGVDNGFDTVVVCPICHKKVDVHVHKGAH